MLDVEAGALGGEASQGSRGGGGLCYFGGNYRTLVDEFLELQVTFLFMGPIIIIII